MSRLDAIYLKRFWEGETPSGLVNGTNTVFTIAQAPLEGETVDVFLDGLKQRPGTDYTVSGSTITFTTAPVAGQTIRVDYIRARGE